MSADPITSLITGLVAVVLTLLVFSRLIGDNPAFRLVQYLFVGISLGYAFVVIYHQVLRPHSVQLIGSLNDPAALATQALPFLLGLLLVARLTRHQSASWLANIPLALIFGVGTALAIGGALAGTLLPQLLDTARPRSATLPELIGSVLLLIGVVLTLCSFYFTVPRETPGGRVVAIGAVAGRWLLLITFGFFFAGSLLTYLTALNERLAFLVGWLRAPFGG